VAEVLTVPVEASSVWRGDELTNTDRWIVPFTEEDLADFEGALAAVSARDFGELTDLRAEDFPLPRFRERIADVADRLERGLGLVLLRGLPIYDRFSEQQATIIYWGLGCHLGRLVPQNRKGDLIGHIRDLGRRGPYERAYATSEDLGFHTDSTDFVGLLCLRPALYGGESFVASSGLLYNTVIGEHPEYLPILNKSFPTDWRSEEPPGSRAGTKSRSTVTSAGRCQRPSGPAEQCRPCASPTCRVCPPTKYHASCTSIHWPSGPVSRSECSCKPATCSSSTTL